MSESANSVASGCSAAMDAAAQKRDVQPEDRCPQCNSRRIEECSDYSGYGELLNKWNACGECSYEWQWASNTGEATDAEPHAAG